MTEHKTEKKEGYVGLTANSFKERFRGHTSSFKHIDKKGETALSIYIWELKEKRIKFNIKWKILETANTFSPTNNKCMLCLREKYYIIYRPDLASLNQRNEIGSACRHKRKVTLEMS